MLNFFKKRQSDETNFDDFPAIGGLMVSKMVVDENTKPRFMYREKKTRPEDSGWRIFTGFESAEYNSDSNNIGIYNPSTILKIDPSIAEILLKGIGSVFERSAETDEWLQVTDFEIEGDCMTTHKLTEEWIIEINNLFERTVEENGDVFYTTGDKSARIAVWNDDRDKETLYAEHKQVVENRDQTENKTLQTFDFSDAEVAKVGYLIEENDGAKTYGVLYGFSNIDKQLVDVALYFDEGKDLDWAIATWKSIRLKK